MNSSAMGTREVLQPSHDRTDRGKGEAEGNGAIAERRSGLDDRRRGGLPLFRKQRRRRRAGRRATDKAGYVDIYDFRCWAVAFSVLILSLLDAILTGVQIHLGRTGEANPLLQAALLHGGFSTFFVIKGVLTALPLAFIMLHKEWALARHAARLCLWSYILVAVYHIYLISI